MIRQFGRLGLVGLLSLVSVAAGCRILPDTALSHPADQVICHGFSGPPRVRFGSYPSSNIGTFFIGPDLGTHGYSFRLSEKDGIAYTCRGGTIDVIHVRISADWTAYLTAVTYRHLMDRDSSFSCKLAVDRSRSFITFTYPENWVSLSRTQQMAIAKEVALAVGPYLAFTMTTWHEMLTWYGFKCIGPFPEFPSAFSWEDSYSNLLGTIVGAHALQDSEHILRTRQMVREGKSHLCRELKNLGLSFVSGEGNFLMVKLPMSDTLAYRKLMAQGVMVRTMTGFRFPNYIRITISGREAMEALVEALSVIIGK